MTFEVVMYLENFCWVIFAFFDFTYPGVQKADVLKMLAVAWLEMFKAGYDFDLGGTDLLIRGIFGKVSVDSNYSPKAEWPWY